MIFVDTGAFCAFADRSDSCHVIAVRQVSAILRERLQLITTNFVVDETYTWMRYRLGNREAAKFLRRLRQSEEKEPRLEITTVSRALENEATRLLEKLSDQDLSYTDATSLALIHKKGLLRAFTFDRHFLLLPIEIIPGITR
jgi:uncharacterized protein